MLDSKDTKTPRYLQGKTIAQKAKDNGVNPVTAMSRIASGWSEDKATTTPARKYKRKLKYGAKAPKVWAYLVDNPLARPCDVAKATNVSYGYAHALCAKVSTPREVFEKEAEAKLNEINVEVNAPTQSNKIFERAFLAGVLVLLGAALVIGLSS